MSNRTKRNFILLPYVFMLIFVDTGVSASEPERKDESLCHSESNRTVTCPDDHFIDMLPDEEHSPVAVFIQDFSCPNVNDRETILSNISRTCQRNATDLLMSCHGEKECSLDPSYAQPELKNTTCPSTITNFIFFSYRCFNINPQNNVAVMASPKEEFQGFKGQDGNIFSPNFPGPVPELSQLTSCTLISSTLADITIRIQYLYLNGVHTTVPLCQQRLEFTTSNESRKTYCSPRFEMGALEEYFIIPNEDHLNIIFTKCSKSKGGKFWVHFTATRSVDVLCKNDTDFRSCNESNDFSNVEDVTTMVPHYSTITSHTEDPNKQPLGIILGAVFGAVFCILLLVIVLVFFKLRARKTRKSKESSDSERSFTVVERMSVQNEEKFLQRKTCSDADSVPVAFTSNGGTSLTITQTTAESPVDEDNNKSAAVNDVSSPTEFTDDNVHAPGSETKAVVEDPSHNSENTYAHIDKSRKDLKRREVSGYEKVLGFVPRIDRVENLTGSDTFMCENDLYGKVVSQSQPSKTEILNEEMRVEMNDASDRKKENNCESIDTNGSPKEEMREELNENTGTQLEKHESNFISVDNNDGSNTTGHKEIANKDDSSDDILDQSNVQEKSTAKSRLCAVNSETIMKDNMDIYSEALPATEADEY